MSKRLSAFGWSIDLAPGWNAEIRHDTACGETTIFLAITSEAKDAMLRLTPDDRGIMAAANWVEIAGLANRAKGRLVSVIQCGDFSGNTVEFKTGDDWIRGWALCCGSSPLDATYRCKATIAGRDDPAVDEMLSTLRVEVASASGS